MNGINILIYGDTIYDIGGITGLAQIMDLKERLNQLKK